MADLALYVAAERVAAEPVVGFALHAAAAVHVAELALRVVAVAVRVAELALRVVAVVVRCCLNLHCASLLLRCTLLTCITNAPLLCTLYLTSLLLGALLRLPALLLLNSYIISLSSGTCSPDGILSSCSLGSTLSSRSPCNSCILCSTLSPRSSRNSRSRCGSLSSRSPCDFCIPCSHCGSLGPRSPCNSCILCSSLSSCSSCSPCILCSHCCSLSSCGSCSLCGPRCSRSLSGPCCSRSPGGVVGTHIIFYSREPSHCCIGPGQVCRTAPLCIKCPAIHFTFIAAAAGLPWFTDANWLLFLLANRWCATWLAVGGSWRIRIAASSPERGLAFTPPGPLKLVWPLV